ncbi:hypothetical protein C8R43DRAFT_968485 [Mycena crocata]|nr:hypothetical protein C8R43DRAFT_968485 [Mycena crocata]
MNTAGASVHIQVYVIAAIRALISTLTLGARWCFESRLLRQLGDLHHMYLSMTIAARWLDVLDSTQILAPWYDGE